MWIAIVYMGGSKVVMTVRVYDGAVMPMQALVELQLANSGCDINVYQATPVAGPREVFDWAHRSTLDGE